ncbi:PadR family transcriptional regulator [Candidatus Izimaplasma bacterium ZiA1]|uniref:PadR family transcriptional regulator n=1 Tax=Candidatus Izimoplasma sp. ZiA1 TaxID=2024899 RepID=UPI000BAA8ACA|nr:PadR family transcriptional regulator [Candidatus Izimaplasma bacterium ZiA1]
MNSQFKRGIIELCALKVISEKDMYSFEVIDQISRDIEVNENTIYPLLRRLTKQGLFETYTETVAIGAPRKYFKITVEGKKRLESLDKEWRSFLRSVLNILDGENNEK